MSYIHADSERENLAAYACKRTHAKARPKDVCVQEAVKLKRMTETKGRYVEVVDETDTCSMGGGS